MAGKATYEHHLSFMRGVGRLRFVIEPWGEPFDLKKGQIMTVFVRSEDPPRDDPIEVVTDAVSASEATVVMHAPSSAIETRLEIDGQLVFESY